MQINSSQLALALMIALALETSAHARPNLSGYLSDNEAEALVLRKPYGAKRDGDKLILKTKSGDKVFTNTDSTRFHLAGYEQFTPEKYFLVYSVGQGGPSYSLVNAVSGAELGLIGPPTFSPRYKRFSVMYFDGDAGLTPSFVRIYGHDGNGFKLEWEKGYGKGTRSGPTDPVWADEDTLVYFENSCGDDAACRLIKSPVEVKSRDGKWDGPKELK